MSELNPKDLSIAEENKDDFKQSVIERKNLTNQFTIADIERHLVTLKKLKAETDGTVSLAEKMIENIERNHGDLIKNTSEEDRSHLWLFQENFNVVAEGEPKQKEIDEEIKKHEGYLDTIYKKFGFQDKIELDVSDGELKVKKNDGSKIKRPAKG